jgi:hypothetical protein
VINDLGGCRDIVWASEFGIFVISHFSFPVFSTSSDGKTWIKTAIQNAAGYICITYSPELNIFISVSQGGDINKSTDGGLN